MGLDPLSPWWERVRERGPEQKLRKMRVKSLLLLIHPNRGNGRGNGVMSPPVTMS